MQYAHVSLMPYIVFLWANEQIKNNIRKLLYIESEHFDWKSDQDIKKKVLVLWSLHFTVCHLNMDMFYLYCEDAPTVAVFFCMKSLISVQRVSWSVDLPLRLYKKREHKVVEVVWVYLSFTSLWSVKSGQHYCGVV